MARIKNLAAGALLVAAVAIPTACSDTGVTPPPDSNKNTDAGAAKEAGAGKDTNGGCPISTIALNVAKKNVFNDQWHDQRSGSHNLLCEQLAASKGGFVSANTCGTIGVIFRDRDKTAGKYGRLAYLEIDAKSGVAGKAETIFPLTRDPVLERYFSWSLVYDTSCKPQVFAVVNNKDYGLWTKGGSAWSSKTGFLDLAKALGQAPTSLTHHLAQKSDNNNIYLLFDVTLPDKNKKFVRAMLAGSAWTVTGAEVLGFTGEYTVDAKGVVHAAYSNDRHLYYGLLQTAGSWKRQLVQKRENYDADAARGFSIAIGAGGEPAIAANYVQRVPTGSYKWSQLRYHAASHDKWSSTILASTADGYVGGDGNHYTGHDPHLVIPKQGQPHITFNDIASWHTSKGWNEMTFGQVRYAVFDGKCWKLGTVYKQTSQATTAKPLYDFHFPTLVVQDSGKKLHFLGVDRVIESDTPIYDLNVKITCKGTHFLATPQ